MRQGVCPLASLTRPAACPPPLPARLQVKQQKTLDANQKALKAAEKKAQQQLKQVRQGGSACACGHDSGRRTAHPTYATRVLPPPSPPPPPPRTRPCALQVRSAAAAPAITRKPFWFEKFFWFISSENYLVLSGRDAQQVGAGLISTTVLFL